MKTSKILATRQVQPMEAGAAKQLLLSASRRAPLFLFGPIAQELQGCFKTAAETYDASRVKFGELCKKARGGDQNAQQEVQAIQVWTIDNFLKVQSLWAGFFEQATLADADVAYIENIQHRTMLFLSGAADGMTKRWQPVVGHDKQMVQFYALTTDEMEYTVRDWYSGMVADRAKAGFDVTGDLGLQLDYKFQTMVKAAIGPFTLTGTAWSRVYLPHSRFATANLPTTNLVTQTGITTTSLLTLEGLKKIITYARSWGENAWGDGPLTPTTVFIPSSLFAGFLDQVEIDDPENEMNRQIFDFGIVANYGGFNWTFIADPTLVPNDGLAFVRFNKPYGMHWSKPSLDQLIIDNSAAMVRQNKESIQMTKVFATYAPNQHRVRVAAIRFRTAS